MSALGQKRTLEDVQLMSALPPKADITLHVPMCQTATLISLFDHLDRA
jgi:hypothetical protein